MSALLFDLIVVGAGPAGSAAACTAAHRGLRVALVDKEEFPREKLCGGLLTLRAQKVYARVFPRAWDEAVEARAHGLSLLGPDGRRLNEVREHHLLQFTCRRRFDALLLDQAVEAGATPLLGSAVQQVDDSEGAVRLSDGRRLQGRAVIGADGVRSSVARQLFGRSFDPRTIALGMEMEVPRCHPGAADLDLPEIHFGLARWGYGWVFPKRATLTVGLGGLLRHNPQLKTAFRAMLAHRFGSVPDVAIKGHHIPYGDYLTRPGRGRVLLCGDAAGLVEPITGEGIAFAMHSGREAALAVHEALQGRTEPLAAYLPRYRELVQDFRIAKGLRQLIFPRLCEPLFLRALPRLRQAPGRHMDLMADELGYPAYARYIALSVVARGWRKLLPF
ncbi:geranylgeranyl reductase family protein [Aquabacterium sp. A7-Y]|uniref:NAD(P)/FAD-dependent oxidoreductase n=1 Tax=Aquabacterium sp. A7-Y TaxID=1349605 RepID=UPI00223DD6DA|nr:geranylgeranyl reductase family protein [Aquabacterium sp. A7-Y]MCW7539185.1 geranylgeranyl reductase family protein [Aquabacterium sp. A7-Y]